MHYDWPGNNREMRNTLERTLIMACGGKIDIRHLPVELQGKRRSSLPRFDGLSLEKLEKQHIENTLLRHNGNRTHAADELGITRATLINKIRKYDLDAWASLISFLK